jgi:ferredoxin
VTNPDNGFAVRIEPQGWQFQAPRDQSLREAAARAGVVLPSSCRNGTCRECLCRLLDGRVSYAIEWPGLSADEKREGYILPCVARAESDLVIQAPRALPLTR